MAVWAWFAIAAGIGVLTGIEVWSWLRHGVSAISLALAGAASLGAGLLALLVGGTIVLGMVSGVADWGSGEAASGCHPSYQDACLDAGASDYDCVGGSGNGPEFVGVVTVVGPDDYGLDRDGDGTGCD